MHYRQHTVLSHQVPQYVEILLCSRGMTLFHWGGGGGGGGGRGMYIHKEHKERACIVQEYNVCTSQLLASLVPWK